MLWSKAIVALSAILLASVSAEPTLTSSDGNINFNVEAGKRFSVLCPEDTGEVPCVGPNVEIEAGQCQPSTQLVSKDFLQSQNFASKADLDTERATLETNIQQIKDQMVSAQWVQSGQESIGPILSVDLLDATSYQQNILAGIGLDKYYNPRATSLLQCTYTDTTTSASVSVSGTIVRSEDKGGVSFDVQCELRKPMDVDKSYRISVSFAGSSMAIPYTGAEGGDVIKVEEMWTMAFTRDGAVYVEGHGLDHTAASGDYRCAFTDSAGLTKRTDASVMSSTSLECGSYPSGFNIDSDGPVSSVTLVVECPGVSNCRVGYHGTVGGSMLDLDTCKNGVMDGTETHPDCGGHCMPCASGQTCDRTKDCQEEFMCIAGYCRGTPTSCMDYIGMDGSMEEGIYEIGRMSTDAETSMSVYCLGNNSLVQTGTKLGSSGWSLVMVKANDGVKTYNWENRMESVGPNGAPFGSITQRRKDFKSEVYNTMKFTDVLFVMNGGSDYPETNLWAQYNDVGDGSMTVPAFISSLEPQCYKLGANTATGRNSWAMAAGNLVTQMRLCNTRLYINTLDHEGRETGSSCSPTRFSNDAYGFNWNGRGSSGGCFFDDPGGLASFAGIDGGTYTGNQRKEYADVGPLLPYLNKKLHDRLDDAYIHLYVR